jgi:hypothetical protein
VQLTSPHGQRAVSLQERQMEMLRERIKGLEMKIVEMIRHGQENLAIADRLHRFVRAAADHRSSRPTCRRAWCRRCKHEFLIPQAAIRLWGVGRGAGRQPFAGRQRRREELCRQPHAALLRRQRGFEASKWLDDPAAVDVAGDDPAAPRRALLRPAGAGFARPHALQRRHGHRVPDAHRRVAGRGAEPPAARPEHAVATAELAPELQAFVQHLAVERRLAAAHAGHVHEALAAPAGQARRRAWR